MKATLPQHIKLDEREHVEKPPLDQLAAWVGRSSTSRT